MDTDLFNIYFKGHICFVTINNKTSCFNLKNRQGKFLYYDEIIDNFKFNLGSKLITPEKESRIRNEIQRYFGSAIEQDNYIESFSKRYFSNINYDYDDIIILNSNIGESNLFLAYMSKPFFEKNNIKKPLFIPTKPYLTDIIKLYYPEANYTFRNLYASVELDNLKNSWNFNGHNFHLVFHPYHYGRVNSDMGSNYYVTSALEALNITKKECSLPEFSFEGKIKNSLDEKISNICLNTDKFIFIAPEADTFGELDVDFWQYLISSLIAKGYDIFLNYRKYKYSPLKGKVADLNLQEALLLTTKAKYVISNRSGFTEFLIPANSKNIILYPKIAWCPAPVQKCLGTYSTLGIPHIKKYWVKEIDTTEFEDIFELEKHVLSYID